MLNFSQVTELVTGLFSDAEAPQGALGDILAGSGIDPSTLQDLPVEQLAEILSSHGIDPSLLAQGEWSDNLQQLADGGLEGIDLLSAINIWRNQ